LNRNIFSWHIAGIFFVFLVGGAWHFVYSLSGSNWLIALIAPVNESVWEHLKLAPIPLLLFSIFEFFYIGKLSRNFIIACTAALYLIPILIVVFHYSYRIPVGHPILWADILIFGLSVTIAELTSYRIMTQAALSPKLQFSCIIAVLILFVVFAVLTFYPPNRPIFVDSKTGSYGIGTLKS